MFEAFRVCLSRIIAQATPIAHIWVNLTPVSPSPISADYPGFITISRPISSVCTHLQKVQELIDAGKHPDDEIDAVSFVFRWSYKFTIEVVGARVGSVTLVGQASRFLSGFALVNEWQCSFHRIQ